MWLNILYWHKNIIINNSLQNVAGLPDYSNRVEVVSVNTQSGSFTATDNGMLLLSYSGKDGFISTTVNDNYTGNLIIGCGTSFYIQTPVTFILSKGDVVKWQGNTANVYVTTNSSFFPFK